MLNKGKRGFTSNTMSALTHRSTMWSDGRSSHLAGASHFQTNKKHKLWHRDTGRGLQLEHAPLRTKEQNKAPKWPMETTFLQKCKFVFWNYLSPFLLRKIILLAVLKRFTTGLLLPIMIHIEMYVQSCHILQL